MKKSDSCTGLFYVARTFESKSQISGEKSSHFLENWQISGGNCQNTGESCQNTGESCQISGRSFKCLSKHDNYGYMSI